MERNVMGELNVYRRSGAKPNFSEIARRRGIDRHTVAKYWREGESAADGRSARGSAFDPLEEEIRAKPQLPGMTKMAVYAFLREDRGEGLPGYGAFTAWCRARDVPFIPVRSRILNDLLSCLLATFTRLGASRTSASRTTCRAW